MNARSRAALVIPEAPHPPNRTRIRGWMVNEVAQFNALVAVIADQDGDTGVLCVAESPSTKD